MKACFIFMQYLRAFRTSGCCVLHVSCYRMRLFTSRIYNVCMLNYNPKVFYSQMIVSQHCSHCHCAPFCSLLYFPAVLPAASTEVQLRDFMDVPVFHPLRCTSLHAPPLGMTCRSNSIHSSHHRHHSSSPFSASQPAC